MNEEEFVKAVELAGAELPAESTMETLRVCIDALIQATNDPKIVVAMLVGGAIQTGFRVMSDDELRAVMDAVLIVTREQRELARKQS